MAKQPLSDRINDIKAEIQANIDRIIDRENKLTPGVPRDVLKQMLTARAGSCECRQFKLMEQEGRS